MKNTFKALALAAMVAVSMLASSCAFAQTEEVAHHLYQLRQHCAARGGSVVSSTHIKASFAFDVVVGEPITMGHCLLAMHNGEKVTDLHKGVNYVVIDLNRYLNFVPYDVEEIKALGRHAEVIGVGDKKGVKITGFYSRWNVPANFKVNVYDVDTGSNRQYFVDEGAWGTVFGPAVHVPAPGAPAPSLPAPGGNSGGGGGEGGGGCNATGSMGWLLAIPALVLGRKKY